MINISNNEQGFVTGWLVSGTVCTPYTPPADLPRTWDDQLGYEKALRGVFYPRLERQPAFPGTVGVPGPCGAPWRYHYTRGSGFVDVSSVHGQLTCLRLDAATLLCSDRDREVQAVFWTFDALDVWLNGRRVLRAQDPVYKPIRRYPVTLALHRGENPLYLVMHNLGVRDTRNIFGLQLPESAGVSAALPDTAAPAVQAAGWLDGLCCAQGQLRAPRQAPDRVFLEYGGTRRPLQGGGPWPLAQEIRDFRVVAETAGGALSRPFELAERIGPMAVPPSPDPYTDFLRRLAAQKSQPRSNNASFGVFHVLARLALGISGPEDEALLQSDLDYIEQCCDCADFLVVGLLRLVHNYPVSPALGERIRRVLLDFRYWMDEPGSDGMCFWSENHALMFYGAQLAVGQMFPDEIFTRSGRTGRRQAEIAAERCRQWLDDVERDGVEEFNSASYMPVTLTALLNLFEYGPEPLARRAGAVMDALLRQLCLHVFDQSVISPQGRVYRDVIYPSRQTVQTLLHLIDPAMPCSTTESMWYACFVTSRYRFPADLRQIMEQEVSTSYVSGNARIELEKHPDYILTSVRSPRAPDDAPHWTNLCFVPGADRSTNTYVKSLNERFHGTSVFQPGVYGYQQHLWYAAVSSRAVVFVTHPGSDTDLDSMRPGYWYGNGVMPAVLQRKNVLGAVYRIPADHPIGFTHTFWPWDRFDETFRRGHWLFGRHRSGYIGLWCSGEQVPHEGVLSGCEYRCYAPDAAYFCVCAGRQDTSWETFPAYCARYAPSYDLAEGVLTARDYTLAYVPHENKTQFI